ncbi:MAG: hypothetical protein ACOCWD_07795 [Tangfeifania sp.]
MFYLIFLTAFNTIISMHGPNEDRIKKAIFAELNYYPEAHLRDIYKNFFQDAYGPGHLIPDTTHAGEYLNVVLKEPIEDIVTWQAIGPSNDYYRINLQLVKDGILPRNVLLNAMVESAPLARNPDIETWKKEWQKTLSVIDELNLQFPNFEKDKQLINNTLSKGEVTIHHSEHYKNTYKRHYRIVHKTVFRRWKGKYFK